MRKAGLVQERSEQSSWRLEEGAWQLERWARVWAFGSSRKSVVHSQPLHSIKTNPCIPAAPSLIRERSSLGQLRILTQA